MPARPTIACIIEQTMTAGKAAVPYEVLEPTDFDTSDRSEQTVGCVILAAGMGTRYADGNKLLSEIDGVPIVRRAVQTFLDVLDDVVVVIGHEASAVRAALDGLDIAIVMNENYDHGQSTSLHRGVVVGRNRGWDAIVFGLGDMPFIRPESVDLLVHANAATEYTILAAAYERKRGNPTLFDAVHYDALATIEGDSGGRRLIIESDETACVETDDPGVIRDIDTVEDHEGYQ